MSPRQPPRDDDPEDVLQGTLDMLVLRAIQHEPMHGWGITDRLEQWSERVLQLGQGTLYPALYRLERQGLLDTDWGTSDNNRKAKFYRLTRSGRARLREEAKGWQRTADAMAAALGAKAEEI